MEEAERLLAVTELLVALRLVSEVVPMGRVLRPVRMELQVDLKMLSDVTEETEHLPVLTVRLAVVRIGLVDLLQPIMELLAVDKEVLEELLAAVRVVLAEFLQTPTEFLAPVRLVLEEELTVLVEVVLVGLLQPLTELLAAARAVLEEPLVAVIMVLADLLQVPTQLLAVGREILVEHLVAVEAVLVDLLQILTEHLGADREVLGRLAVKHPPTLMEHLLVGRMVCMVETGHLLALTVHQMAEATVLGSEAEGDPTGLSQLDRVQVADMEVALAMTDLL